MVDESNRTGITREVPEGPFCPQVLLRLAEKIAQSRIGLMRKMRPSLSTPAQDHFRQTAGAPIEGMLPGGGCSHLAIVFT